MYSNSVYLSATFELLKARLVISIVHSPKAIATTAFSSPLQCAHSTLTRQQALMLGVSVACFWLSTLFKMIHLLVYAYGSLWETYPSPSDATRDVGPEKRDLSGMWDYDINFEAEDEYTFGMRTSNGWENKLYPGIGIYPLSVAGEVFYIFADWLMLFKIILVSKVRMFMICLCKDMTMAADSLCIGQGLTITRRRLSSKSLFRVPLYMTLYLLFYLMYMSGQGAFFVRLFCGWLGESICA